MEIETYKIIEILELGLYNSEIVAKTSPSAEEDVCKIKELIQTLQASTDQSKLLLADVSKCNCQTPVKCDNCGEMVIKISTGEFCPSCYC